MAIRRRAHLIRRREHLHMATCAQQRLDAQVQGHAGVHKRRIVQSPTLQRHSRASGWSVKVEIVEYAVQNAEILALAVGQVRRRDRLEHCRGWRDRLGKAAILRQRRSRKNDCEQQTRGGTMPETRHGLKSITCARLDHALRISQGGITRARLPSCAPCSLLFSRSRCS